MLCPVSNVASIVRIIFFKSTALYEMIEDRIVVGIELTSSQKRKLIDLGRLSNQSVIKTLLSNLKIWLDTLDSTL